jgi:hypothetical protein
MKHLTILVDMDDTIESLASASSITSFLRVSDDIGLMYRFQSS